MDQLPPLPHDIHDPQPYLPGIAVPWWVWVLAALALAGFLAAVVILWPRSGRPVPPPIPPFYADCLARLEKLRENAIDRPLAEVATEASLALRGYLSGALAEPALFETHEETLLREHALEALPQGARDRLAPLLGTLADYKYGPSRHDDTLAGKLIDDCLETLRGIESTRARPIA